MLHWDVAREQTLAESRLQQFTVWDTCLVDELIYLNKNK